jgi:hypothetical protein
MTRLDKTATLLPLIPQLRTCLCGSDRRALSARSGLMQRNKFCTRVAAYRVYAWNEGRTR